MGVPQVAEIRRFGNGTTQVRIEYLVGKEFLRGVVAYITQSIGVSQII